MLSPEEEKSNLQMAQLYSLMLAMRYRRENFAWDRKALAWNIANGNIDLNQRIISTKHLESSQPDLIGSTPLHLACYKDLKKGFNILLQINADFTLKNKNGLTVIHQVIEKTCVNSKGHWNLEEKLDNFYVDSILSAHIKFENVSNPCDEDGISHFHAACMSDNAKAVDFFLKNGVSVEQSVKKNSSILSGYTPLHFAARCTNLEAVKVLLNYGANVNSKDVKGITPMHLLIDFQISNKRIPEGRAQKIDQIKRLFLEKNLILGDLSVDNIGLSNFHVACTMFDSSLVENLLEKIEDINHSVNVDSSIWPGFTGLHFAVYSNNLDAFQLLVKKGADINIKNDNKVPLFDLFMDKCKTEYISDILKSNPAWDDIILSDGKTKLLDVVNTINDPFYFLSTAISSLSDMNISVPDDSVLWPGYTILHLAVILLNDGSFEKLEEQILSRDADICAQDTRGWTPLQLAFRLEKRNFVVVMLRNFGKTINPIDEDGLSHLHICGVFGNKSLIEKILSTGTDVNSTYKGISVKFITEKSTALHCVHRAYNDGARVLLKANANLYIKDVNNATPLHLLLLNDIQTLNLIYDELIASYDSLKNFYSTTGLSLLHIASYSENAADVERLLDLGEDTDKTFIYEQPIDVDNHNINTMNYKLRSHFSDFLFFRPLHFAVYSYNYEVVDVLLSRGAALFPGTPKFYPDFFKKYSKCLYCIISTTKNRATLERLNKELNLTPLHVACHKIDVESIRDLLKQIVDVNAQIDSRSPIWPGSTPLHVLLKMYPKRGIDNASRSNISIILELLVEKGADITLMNVDQSSPLHLAYLFSSRNQLEKSRLSKLLESHGNFDVNPVHTTGISHFYIACSLSNAAIVRKFLEQGVDVNEKCDIFTNDRPSPLHASLEKWSAGHEDLSVSLETIDLLLKYGAEISTVNCDGDTPLHMVVGDYRISECYRESVVEKLISYGSDVSAMNIKGESAFEKILHESYCSEKELEIFLRHTNYLNVFNPITKVGLMGLIFTNRNPDLFEMIFDIIKSTPQNAKTDAMGRTAIHNAISTKNSKLLHPFNNSYMIFDKLFFSDLANIVGCNINDQDIQGKTALHYSSSRMNTKAISGLLEAGANPNIFDACGNVALHFAVQCDNTEALSALLLGGADTNMINAEGDSVCHIAVNCGNLNALSILLESGIELDVIDAKGRTAFDILLEIQKSNTGLALQLHISEMEDVFVVHFLKLKYSGFNLSGLNLNLESHEINFHFDRRDLFQQQLEKTKDVQIEPYSLTLYDYFSKIDEMIADPFASLLKCQAINDFFESNQSKEFQEKFSEMMPVLKTLHRKSLKILRIKLSLDKLAKFSLQRKFKILQIKIFFDEIDEFHYPTFVFKLL